MRAKPLLLPMLALTAGCAATSAEPRSEDPLGKDNDTTRELARRTAGEPQDCVPIEPGRSLVGNAGVCVTESPTAIT